MMRRLNLGCQVHHFEDWVNQDIVSDDPNIKVELACDAIKLPLNDGDMEFIYAGHLVEHFYPNTLFLAIIEWNRVLQKGGKLVIVTPDCGAVMKDYAAGKISIEAAWQQLYGRIYDYDRDSERHHIAFDMEKLRDMTTKFERIEGGNSHNMWSSIQPLDFNNPPIELVPFMDTHISRGAYQLGIILTK